MKEWDSSQKNVYHCDLCAKWFCEKHLSPKFPFFVDWETISAVQGNPEIRALYYFEYKREGGHPDFVYWRRKFEALDIEEKTRNELIKQAMDRMNRVKPKDDEAKRKESWERYYQIVKDKERIADRGEDWKDESKEESKANKPKRYKEVIVDEGPFHFVKKRVEVDRLGRVIKEPKKKKHW